MQEDANRELEALEASLGEEEESARRVFEGRKRRLLWRWKVSEAIERRRLELERGQEFGELPDVRWGVEERVLGGSGLGVAAGRGFGGL